MSEKATKDPPYDFHKAAYEVAQAPNVICSGMMSKQDRKMGVVWRKRFFILLENPSSSNTPSSPRNQYTPSIQVLSNNITTTTTTGLSATNSPSLLSSSSSSSTSLGVSSASSSVRSNRHFSMNMSGLQAAAAASSSQQLFTNTGASSTNNHDIILYYFKSPTDTVSISSINVRFGVESVETIQYTKVRKYGLKIVTKNQREYLLCCDEESEQSKWLNHLTLAKKGSALSKSSENLSQPISVSTPLLTGSPKVIHRHIQSSIPLGVFNAISSPSTATTPLVKKDESYNRWHDWCLNQCQIGCKVIKLPYLASCSGVEKKRFLQLSKDAKVIRWGTTTIHKSTSKISQEEDTRIHQSLDRHINMSQVTAVHYGVSSNTFQRYLEKVMTSYEATNCISFVVKTNNGASRTIDLIFLNSDDAMAWYLLLTVFKSTTSTPTQSTDQIIADFKWSRLRLSVQQRCFLNQTSLVNFMEEQVYLLQ
ncbi:hypothetical protein C9374_006197 [Naegleria lovaniensis]|uniref:PH domain-containing protein n=1 Tax=Naegleria lovaniensis TaxID=51637 RepID=A0AA88KJG3_NAELO|nr:uncharacterized protein C9374_006197 [Naegleria lovaniensis]KAG2381813.1 hypothetical protein C9374_006197 [Naegleria lovaniensis]